ncbi:hypothetical protein B0H14DRAFT_1528114 [Mycena olivaceomarginata]|nr:hypothetical protein B0H14DRAFT_1528114 [Mycena olivaceomarginata]
MECFTYNGHLYNLIEDGRSVHIQHISRRSLRSGHCEESGRYISEKAFSENGSDPFRGFAILLPTTPRYGISAVFVRIKEDVEDDSRSLTLFTFLPSSLTHAPDDGVSSPLAFDSPPISQIVPGYFVGRKWSWLDHSGLNLVAALSQSRHGGCDKVFLVRYDPETMSTSVRALTDPLYFTGLETLEGLCVDATAGAVHLVENEGVFSTIRYV